MLEIKDLVFEVPLENDPSKKKRIIDGLSLTVADDRFTVITGPNGGGKSTLAKLIMGMEQPTSGSITFDGVDVTHLPITERARLGIGYGFYDEPEAGIDLWSFDRLTETFRDIHEAREGHSIVIISHQERIIQLADEVVVLQNGKIVRTGTPEGLMPDLGFASKGINGCVLSEPLELHLTDIPTTC